MTSVSKTDGDQLAERFNPTDNENSVFGKRILCGSETVGATHQPLRSGATRSLKAVSRVLDAPLGTPRIAVCAALDTRSAPSSCSSACFGPGGRAVMGSVLFGSIGGAPSRSWRSRWVLQWRGCSLEARARLPESAPRTALARFRRAVPPGATALVSRWASRQLAPSCCSPLRLRGPRGRERPAVA
jgi:hypothetical protein